MRFSWIKDIHGSDGVPILMVNSSKCHEIFSNPESGSSLPVGGHLATRGSPLPGLEVVVVARARDISCAKVREDWIPRSAGVESLAREGGEASAIASCHRTGETSHRGAT